MAHDPPNRLTRCAAAALVGCMIVGSGTAALGEQLSETLAGMNATVDIAPPQDTSPTASLQEIAAPQTRRIVGEGDREITIDCPCDVYWRSAGGRFSVSIDAAPIGKGQRKIGSRRISSQNVADLMASVRTSSVRAASSGKGAGRVHIAEAATRRLSIRAEGAWSVAVMTAF